MAGNSVPGRQAPYCKLFKVTNNRAKGLRIENYLPTMCQNTLVTWQCELLKVQINEKDIFYWLSGISDNVSVENKKACHVAKIVRC